MRKKSVLRFIRNRTFLKGCAALSATVLVGVLSFQRQLPDLPGSVPVGTVVTLEEDDTPLAATPVTTTTKKVKKKITKKKVKLKKAAKANKTKDLGTKKKTKTKTTKSGSTTTKTTVLTVTNKKEVYKKGQKVKTVTTTVTTTTTVQKTTMPSSTSDGGSGSSGNSGGSGSSGNSGGSGSSGSSETGSDVFTPATPTPVPTTAPVATGGTLSEAQLRESAKNFNIYYPLVLDSFIERGCTCVIDPSAGFTGLFDASKRTITLRENDETIYHELGHFVALGARRLDNSQAFRQIFQREGSKFPGEGKIYALSSAGEYFAESMREYMASDSRRAALERECPSTANAVKTALGYFQDSTIDATNRYLKVYTKQ